MRILLFFIALLGVYGSTPAVKGKPPVTAASISDADLEKDIKARFAKSKISVNNLQVSVRAGVATIEGQVSIVQHKGVATRMARTAGAKKVVNNVKIDEAARQKAANQLSRARPATVKRTQ